MNAAGPESLTVREIVDAACAAAAGAPALLAPGRKPLSYAGLVSVIDEAERALRAAGVGASDRVGLLVENGPAAAAAFLAVACAGAAVPLNPVYREQEVAFALEDAGASALVVGATLDTPGREVAQRLGLPVIDLSVAADGEAGAFTLAGASADAGNGRKPLPEDVALLLHTSGTTARPKLVPLRHRQLAASARNITRVLELRPSDRCLNVMPLFHIHGLVAALLAPLATGGSVACAPGFHQLRFFEWLAELEPTWYTAVPTMHQSVLERALASPESIAGHRLRFLRSSSAALPVPVLEGLERAFGVPVIEAYGMTEAAHQMASNPLPPADRRPGTVGRAAGPEIAILDGEGTLLSPGVVGEVSIRGENVFAGYEHNPEANASAFSDGWFRTGDLGTLSADGYLTLIGRSKELINRGGEKVSPPEVEDVLTRHPSVGQAVVFAIPDARLGEEVAAAVVPAAGRATEPRALQDFVAETLAPFKVPRRVVVVDEIPKGATGKLQRIGLSERLGLEPIDPLPEQRPSLGALEPRLTAIWEEVLAMPGLDAGADFFALGGDSILAAELVARIRDLVGDPSIPLVAIVRASTPAAMASEVYARLGRGHSGLVVVREGDEAPPLVLAHPGDGEVLLYAPLARRLDQRSVYAFRARGIDDDREPHASIEAMAADYVGELRHEQPSGPYLLGGFCMGAPVATEMARQLVAAGDAVEMLVLVNPRFRRPEGLRYRAWAARRRLRLRVLARSGRRGARVPGASDLERWIGSPTEQRLGGLREAYVPEATSIPTALVLSDDFDRYGLPQWYLAGVLRNVTSRVELPWGNNELFLPPAVDRLAEEIRRALANVGRRASRVPV